MSLTELGREPRPFLQIGRSYGAKRWLSGDLLVSTVPLGRGFFVAIPGTLSPANFHHRSAVQALSRLRGATAAAGDADAVADVAESH